MEDGEIGKSPDITDGIDEDDWVSPEKLQLLGIICLSFSRKQI